MKRKRRKFRIKGFEWLFVALIFFSAVGAIHEWGIFFFGDKDIHVSAVAAELPTSENENFKNEVDMGVLTPSGLSVEMLEKGLYSPLKDYAWHFIKAEENTGINAVFLASVAAYESGWGEYATGNNLFGWGDQEFESIGDCIKKVSNRIKKLYLTPDGHYFNGYTVESINVRYNPSTEWGKQVNLIMKQINERIKEVDVDDDIFIKIVGRY